MKRFRIVMFGSLFILSMSCSAETSFFQDAKATLKGGYARTKTAIKDSSQKVKNYFADPALGGVRYYTSMANNARSIKEDIAGEFAINAAYYKHNPKALRQWLQKKGTKSELTTWWKDTTNWFQKETGVCDGGNIQSFIDKHDLDMTDYEKEKSTDYVDFNDFFYRGLKAGVRKVDLRSDVVASPADSKLRVLPNISSSSKFFVKQAPFNLRQFLNDETLAKKYEGGTLLSFRLAPTDYHRFHFPFDCTPFVPVLIKGEYETVSPIAFRVGLWPIIINKRARIELKSPVFGDVMMVVVGASMVASLNFTYAPGKAVKKSDEVGFFAFGGSTICLLFAKDTVVLPNVLIGRSTNKYSAGDAPNKYEKETAFETAVLMGEGVAMEAGAKDVNLLSDPVYVAFLSKTNRALKLSIDDIEIPLAFNVSAKGLGVIRF